MSVRSAFAGMLFAAILLAPVAAFAAQPPSVNVGFDFLWQPERDNDTQVYLHVSNTAFEREKKEVASMYRSIHNPESNLPVVLWIASQSDASVARVWELRSSGMTWIQVMARLKVPQKRLFLELSRDPGPPYGKAYGHWKNRRSKKLKVTDDDVYFWVNVHAMSRYFGVSATTVVDWRTSGKTWKAVAGSEYRKAHPNKTKAKKIDTAGFDKQPGPPAHSKGRGKGSRR